MSDSENEFDAIINQFQSSLKLSREVKQSTRNTIPTMNNQAGSQAHVASFNWNLFKSKVDIIKPYDGDANTLNKFIKACQGLIDSYKDLNDAELNKHIFDCIQGKLIGKAEIMIGNRSELSTWDQFKNALIQCFSDRRNLECLIQELTRTRPFKNEHLLSFGNRLQLLRSQVAQRISNDITLSNDQKMCHIQLYEKTALNTFIAGCTGVLKNNMHIKRPDSIEDAMAYVVEFENFENLYGCFSNLEKSNRANQIPSRSSIGNTSFSPMNSNNSPNYFGNAIATSPMNRNQFIPNSNNQQFNNFPQQAFSFPRPQMNQRSTFPSQPINVQPRAPNSTRFPTNREVFGPPKNVFRPNQTPINQLPKPIPMSGISRATNATRKPFQNQFMQRQQYQRPNFKIEELYNNECDDNQYFGQYNNQDYLNDQYGTEFSDQYAEESQLNSYPDFYLNQSSEQRSIDTEIQGPEITEIDDNQNFSNSSRTGNQS